MKRIIPPPASIAATRTVVRRATSPKMRMAIAFLLFLLLAACNSDFTPKRRGYFKIDFPPHQYRTFDEPGFPYTFEYPVYAQIARDSSYFDTIPENPWWINVDFPQFDARIYISYKQIGAQKGHGSERYNSFEKLRDDAYKMTFKHTVKASSIDDSPIHTLNGVSGVFFNVGGNAATAKQFFLTDTIYHFLRGALYFNTTPNEDSLRIVNDFLVVDMMHFINTFQWRAPKVFNGSRGWTSYPPLSALGDAGLPTTASRKPAVAEPSGKNKSANGSSKPAPSPPAKKDHNPSGPKK
jgi:gliding motility-associated lipoprotein GldD